MKLSKVRVKLFKNYFDSGEAKIEDKITNLVGKNESGKTTFLKALYYLKPANNFDVSVKNDYPRGRKGVDKRKNNLEEVSLIKATFLLDDDELKKFENKFNIPFPKSSSLIIQRKYNGNTTYSFDTNKEDWLKLFLNDIDKEILDKLSNKEDISLIIDELNQLIDELNENGDENNENNEDNEDNDDEEVDNHEDIMLKYMDNLKYIDKINSNYMPADNEIMEMVPTFLYFESYSTLPGKIDLEDLKDKINRNQELDEFEKTSKSLLDLAGVTPDELMDPDFENSISELETAANSLRDDILEYWSQNKHNNVKLAMDPHFPNILNIRLENMIYGSSTNFSTHSNGFQWFFSFLTSFSEFEDRDDVIILLDEPGLSLHGKAQKDLLRFIEEKLSSNAQVIYTNHSPFMVNPKKHEWVRLVEDHSTMEMRNEGAKIHDDVFSVNNDTIFPLQAALGYELSQDLYLGKYNLVLEGKSDLNYLYKISDYLEENGKEYLNDKIRLIPVGGAGNVPTFIALLGEEIDFSVLVDSDMKNNQRIEDMISNGYLEEEQFMYYGEIVNNEYASVEDLFEPEDYLILFNEAYTKNLSYNDIKKDHTSIIDCIDVAEPNMNFSHYKPARILNNEKIENLSKNTLNNYEKLFKHINKKFGLN